MKKLFIAGLLGVGMMVNAEPVNVFNYNFVEGQVVALSNDNLHLNQKNRDDTANVVGLRANGSFDVANNFSVIGSVMDASGNDYDLIVLTAGAAYHQPLPKIADMPFDLVVRAEIEHARASYDFPLKWPWIKDSTNNTGIVFTGGVQMEVLDKLQVFSHLALGSNSEYRRVTLSAGARYEFVPSLEAVASLEAGDMNLFSTGVRYSF